MAAVDGGRRGEGGSGGRALKLSTKRLRGVAFFQVLYADKQPVEPYAFFQEQGPRRAMYEILCVATNALDMQLVTEKETLANVFPFHAV